MKKLVFSYHALQRMGSWTVVDVRAAIERGEEIESYPSDKPFPSRLVLTWRGERALHVVAADDPTSEETHIITLYEPDLEVWEVGFRTRRRNS